MYIIGIDFGHGETSAAMLEYKDIKTAESNDSNLHPSDEFVSDEWDPEKIQKGMLFAKGDIKNLSINGDSKVVKSVIFYDRENENYYINPSFADIKRSISDLKNGEEPYIRAYFKGALVSGRGKEEDGNDLKEIGPREKEAFGRFVKLVYDNIVRQAGLQNKDFKIYVACPSEWEKEPKQVIAYQKFLREQGVPCEKVIAESRAAYMSYRDRIIGNSVKDDDVNTTSEEEDLTEVIEGNCEYAGLRKNILVIDFGSSTIDFTWYGKDSLSPVTDGSQAGAMRVEEDLFRYIKDNEEPAKAGFEMVVKGLKGDDIMAEDILILAMRDIKEKFYKELLGNNPKPVLDEIQLKSIISVRDPETQQEMVSRDMRFGFRDNVYYYKTDVLNILKKSGYYDDVKRALEDFRDKKEVTSVDHVILTGGASKMDFVLDLVEEVFGVKNYSRKKLIKSEHVEQDGEETLTIDDDPSFSISRGIAMFGLYDYLSEPYKLRIEEIFNNTWLNGDWLMEKLSRLIPNTVSQVYVNKLTEIVDEWAENGSSIVFSKNHHLYDLLLPIAKEKKESETKEIWNCVEKAKVLFEKYSYEKNHSIHALLRKVFDYIQTNNEIKEIENLLNTAIQSEINGEVGILLKRYVSIYFDKKEIPFTTNLELNDKIIINIPEKRQTELLTNLIESAFKKVKEIDRRSGYTEWTLDKDRFPNTSVFNTTRKQMVPILKDVMNSFAEQIKPEYSLESIRDSYIEVIKKKYKEVEYRCNLSTYRL